MPNVTSKFESIASVKDGMKKFLQCDVTDIGYVSPGHGAKGKYNDLINDDDLELMYKEYEGRGVFMECCCGVVELQVVQLMLKILKP